MAKDRDIDVLVIGAGIAGLTAALCLQEGGARVVVLEGSAGIGGRVQALRDGDGAVLGDLGPTWVWPRWQPVVARWMDRLALVPFTQHDAGDGILDGFGGPPRRHPLIGQDGISRLVGGPSAIIDALAARLDPQSILTNAKVVEVAADGGALRVITTEGRAYVARRVVLATPLRGTLESIAIAGLAPPLEAAMRAAPTWMAQQAKAVAVYPRPFWREAGLSGRVASRAGPLVEVHDHTPASGSVGAVFGFVGIGAAERAGDPEGLRAAILDQLARCFGPKAGAPTELVIKDWAQEPLTCSALDLARPPEHPEIGPETLRAGHLDGRLWLAVSESAEQSTGLIEGAFLAGERAAQRVLATL
ncbi:Putrescine oxidase [Roseovarius gaetbuli]|uniref:Putrescine oxidase n=1 Tax=Roseovarius gaetbuli TaxID=1356575 RepID=A0A1X7A206_9RHOB|nr:NAD(P)/FAD-dependent oxidoreductase [Roseovarius gaetbuli]SLN68010.1 Putrescine oxidase [Roseovarius gaetbuli]